MASTVGARRDDWESPAGTYLGDPLKVAVQSGDVSQAGAAAAVRPDIESTPHVVT